MKNKFGNKEERFYKKVEGYCSCGSTKKIIKFEHSNLSCFSHDHRFTYENDVELRVNIFRCSNCKQLIEKTFKPSEEAK